MPKIEIPIATGFYEDSSKPVASQECVNWRISIPETNALTRATLKPFTGIEQYTTSGTQSTENCRGAIRMDGILYAVNGTTLYQVNDGLSGLDALQSKGTIQGTSRVSMATNGTQICIVTTDAPYTAYSYTDAGGLVTITDTDFTTTLGPSEGVVYKDGYFIHFNNNSAASTQPIIFKSALNDATSYTALDFGTAEADPDEITGIHVSRDQLYVCGLKTIEPFQNIGGADFPYQTIPGAVVPVGIRAFFSLINYDQSFAYVGTEEDDGIGVYVFRGSSSERISTESIDDILKDYTEAQINDIFCTTLGEGKSSILNVHLSDRTFCYDADQSRKAGKPVWYERKSKDEYGQLINWRINTAVEVYGTTYFGDRLDGRIGRLNTSIRTEYGDSVNRAVSCQPLTNLGERVKVSGIEAVCLTGTANASGAGSDPMISRSISEDGGYTFGNETARSLGAQGNRKARQIWRKEGKSNRNRVYRFVIDEPIDVGIFALWAMIR